MAKVAYTLVSLIGLVVILSSARNYLIPLLLAVLFWYLIRQARLWLRRFSFVERWFSHNFQNVLASLILFGIAFFLLQALLSNIRSLNASLDLYQKNIATLNAELLQWTGWDALKQLAEYSKSFQLSTLIRPISKAVFFVAGNGLMVTLYTLFLLLEEPRLAQKLEMMFKDEEDLKSFRQLITEIDYTCSQYLNIKTIISVLTAMLNYAILWALGVKFAFLWSFLIFTLNYIPNIGPLIATIFPTIAAMLQFGHIAPGLWVLLSVGTVQTLSGNIVETKWLGDSMNVSTLVILVTLVFWGAVWGIVGMFLSVPLTVICCIILSHIPSTRHIAILLSATGNVCFGMMPGTQTEQRHAAPGQSEAVKTNTAVKTDVQSNDEQETTLSESDREEVDQRQSASSKKTANRKKKKKKRRGKR